MESLWIEDGYTLTDSLPAVPGMHPAAELVYRPALARERHVYGQKVQTKNADELDRYETELIARQVVSVGGLEIKGDKERCRRLHPLVRNRLLDLILSFTPAKQAEAEGNSVGG